MTNTVKENYIDVKSYLTTKRGWYQVILVYYENGKRQSKSKSLGIKNVAGNKRKAEKMQREIEREFENELNSKSTTNNNTTIIATNNTTQNINNKILFGTYIGDIWLPSIKSSVEITTYAGYQDKVRIIANYFNNLKIKLCDLKKADIRNFYTYLRTTRNVNNTTVNSYYTIIHKSLEDGINVFELISVNPAHGLRQKQMQNNIDTYTADELKDLFEVAHNVHSPIELHILIAAHYGLRREEVCGLKWQAIDFNAHTIKISHTVTQASVDGKYKLVKKERTKNKNSYRTLPLIPYIENLLKKEYEQQEKNKALFGNSYKNTENYILVDMEGKLIRPDYVTRKFKELIEQNNLRPINFKNLRHSLATMLLANEKTLDKIKMFLGHSTVKTTETYYANNKVIDKKDTAEVITNVLDKNVANI